MSRPHIDRDQARRALAAWRRGDRRGLALHLDGAVRWRRHPRLGPIAARLLEVYDREIAEVVADLLLELREDALDALTAPEPPPPPPLPGLAR